MVLKVGSTGEVVKQVQEALNKELDCGLVVDGKYGSKTRTAVIQFQEKVGLKPDGICGPCTLHELHVIEDFCLNYCVDLKQFDSRWGKEYYGKDKSWSTFANAGCGCISATIAGLYYGYLENVEPYDAVHEVADYAISKGYRKNGKGTSAGVFTVGGMKKTSCSRSGAEDALRAGKLVAVCVRAGWSSYTGNGHWVILYGIDNDEFLVRDVGSSKASRQRVKMSDWKYVKNAYILS